LLCFYSSPLKGGKYHAQFCLSYRTCVWYNDAMNYAFIDGQNLNLGTLDQGWKLDLRRFRVHLRDRYNVETAYYFIGFVPGNNAMYLALQKYGYTLVFKPTVPGKDGKIKGNCDAELVLQAMIDINNYDKAIIISGDGDFACLVKYLREKGKLRSVLAPNRLYCSALLKTEAGAHLDFVTDLRKKLEYQGRKRKEPRKD
jgi:uncharacterized LabA/DUF88 family protein